MYLSQRTIILALLWKRLRSLSNSEHFTVPGNTKWCCVTSRVGGGGAFVHLTVLFKGGWRHATRPRVAKTSFTDKQLQRHEPACRWTSAASITALVGSAPVSWCSSLTLLRSGGQARTCLQNACSDNIFELNLLNCVNMTCVWQRSRCTELWQVLCSRQTCSPIYILCLVRFVSFCSSKIAEIQIERYARQMCLSSDKRSGLRAHRQQGGSQARKWKRKRSVQNKTGCVEKHNTKWL